MSEGLAEVMLLSSGYMSTERPVIAWSSRLRNRRSTFSNRLCFYKPQIWVLNDYILPWNTRVQCRQTLAVVVRRVRFRHDVTRLSERNKATSASDRRPSAPWVLSSAGKLIRYLHGSYFLPYRSADVFLFSFFYPPSLSFCLSARLFTQRSLLLIMSRHAPYCWLATSLFWYSTPTQFSKVFEKSLTLPFKG